MKAFNGEAQSIEKFDVYNDTLYSSAWKSQFLSGLLFPIMSFVGNLGYVGGLDPRRLSGDQRHDHRRRHAGVHPVRALVHAADRADRPDFQRASANRCRRRARLRIPGRVGRNRRNRPPGQAKQSRSGNVEFDHVQFGYNPDKVIIHDFSASVKPGQKIAIVGPTGAGKTTMVKLLMRFYDVNKGAILVDGHNIQEFTRHDLRKMFGMVLQDAWLYSGTIMENIRYGRLDATRRGSHRRRAGRPRRSLRPHAAGRLQHGPQRGSLATSRRGKSSC